MKITRLEIQDYQQFKDFTLDLTYPTDHPTKAGKPLDKVCFIGQSGTGKTTILSIISELLDNGFYDPSKNHTGFSSNEGKLIYGLNFNFFQSTETGTHKKIVSHDGSKQYSHNVNFNHSDKKFKYFFQKDTSKLKNRIIYLQTGLENHIQALLGQKEEAKPLIYTEGDENAVQNKIKQTVSFFETLLSIESNKIFSNTHFQDFLLQELYNYDLKQREVLANLFKQAFNKNVEKVLQDVQKWKIENPNPRIEIDKKLSPILSKFNVKLDTDWADGGLKLKTLQDTEFELPFSSTGTKQILLSALPLILMETAHKVILFDEPERSLYPDIQRELVDFYTNIAPESQFFFATHSPLIAAQFEPCERFILSFDEETGKVQARNGTVPEGDDPNDMLTKDFLLPTLLGKKGEQEYHRFIELKTLIHNASTTDEKHALTHEYLQIQKAYNF